MIELGPHGGFILLAYGGVALAVLGLIVSVVLAHRRVVARLQDLEARGIRRRSSGDRD